VGPLLRPQYEWINILEEGRSRQGRKELAKRGMRLMLDFVPNHVAPDHPWVTDHPEYLSGDYGDSVHEPGHTSRPAGRVRLREGPVLPGLADVLQLNAFNKDSAQRSSTLSPTLPGSATECAAIWRCSS